MVYGDNHLISKAFPTRLLKQERIMKKFIIISIIFFAFLPLVPTVSASWGLKYATTEDTIVAFDPPVAADTNNDGILDSLFIAGKKYGTTDAGIVLRINSADGSEVWRREYTDADASNELNPIELYDVTGDGCPEVFCHFGASTVGYQVGFICLDGVTGDTVWFNMNNEIRPAWHHFVIIADRVTNVPYIYFNNHAPYISMKKMEAATGNVVRTVASGLSCNGGLSAADINEDGAVEIVLGLHPSPGFQVFNANLDLLWQAGVNTYSSTQCASLVDVCGDSTLDLVSLYQCDPYTEHAGLNVIDGGTHQRNNIMSSYDLGLNAHSQGSVADYDSDGSYEITSGYTGFGHLVKIRRDNTPQIITTLLALGEGNGPAVFQDLIGSNRFELVATGVAVDTINFQPILGIVPNQWNGMMNDIDNDGLCELFGCRNGQLTVYDTDKTPIPGINTYTAYYGYRRLNSEVAYEECPGTWWYSWAEWEEDHQGDPLSCDAGGPYIGLVGQAIQFQGGATGGMPPYTFTWDFGDGTTSIEQNPNHSYDMTGIYTITFTVHDTGGNQSFDLTTVTITDDTPTEPPQIKIIRPESAVYLADQKLIPFQFPVVFGKITIGVEVTHPFLPIERVEFYKEDLLQMVDTTPPYSWTWSERVELIGLHRVAITIWAYTAETNNSSTIEIIKFF